MNRGLEAAAGIREGDILAGKYRVERILGAGGMGVVVAAYHIQLDEKVALKFLLPEALDNREAVARFAREARAAVKIKSEHVARIIDVGTLPNGAPFMVMEYLDGGDLGAWLKQRGALPIEQAVEFVLQACVAVADAHALGIVHRDLKPANLFCVRRSDGQLAIKVPNRFADSAITNAPKTRYVSAPASAGSSSTDSFGLTTRPRPSQRREWCFLRRSRTLSNRTRTPQQARCRALFFDPSEPPFRSRPPALARARVFITLPASIQLFEPLRRCGDESAALGTMDRYADRAPFVAGPVPEAHERGHVFVCLSTVRAGAVVVATRGGASSARKKAGPGGSSPALANPKLAFERHEGHRGATRPVHAVNNLNFRGRAALATIRGNRGLKASLGHRRGREAEAFPTGPAGIEWGVSRGTRARRHVARAVRFDKSTSSCSTGAACWLAVPGPPPRAEYPGGRFRSPKGRALGFRRPTT
jgi:predicted Ser/Thr protein kinase